MPWIIYSRRLELLCFFAVKTASTRNTQWLTCTTPKGMPGRIKAHGRWWHIRRAVPGALCDFSRNRKKAKERSLFLLFDRSESMGGVLEHPAASRLWPRCGLPKPGRGFDRYGGWTLGINQWEFGHRAKKPTLLYIVGCNPDSIPDLPLKMGTAEYVIGDVGRAANGTKRPEVSKAEREHTPRPLAEWLMELAIRCTKCAPIT